MIAGGDANILSKVASITITGEVFGTPASTNLGDQFGFVGQQFGTIKVGGSTFTIAAGNVPPSIGETADTDVHRLPSP